ncbi:MAG: hypothetical protein ACFFDN_33165 [Candidatus Hodarchaeota archaeon]
MIELQKRDMVGIKNRIIKYLKVKGELRAALLYKIEKRFCNPNLKFRVEKKALISCLFLMMKDRTIDIIIPELFQIYWKKEYLRNLKFCEENYYFVRKFSNYNNKLLEPFKEYNYYFDSRKLNFDKQDEIYNSINNLITVIEKIPNIKNKIIIYYNTGSKPLNIYEKFDGIYRLKFLDFHVNPQIIESFKLESPILQQKSDLAIIKSYRKNFMCFYIVLIESIQKAIIDLKHNKEHIDNYKDLIRDLTIKFGYYCDMYVRSDWIDGKSNAYRWESFFKSFNLPFKIINLSFKNIKFYGRTFEFWIRFNYCIYINKEFEDIILKLKALGFEEFKRENYNGYVAIGFDHEIFEVCPSIEYFYFLNKYVFYYHLFNLFYYSFSYIEKIKSSVKFTEKERSLYKIFLPVMESMFNIQDQRITKKLIFKYYTYNPDELEVIYNKLLLPNVRFIEKKMFNYFLIRSGKH